MLERISRRKGPNYVTSAFKCQMAGSGCNDSDSVVNGPTGPLLCTVSKNRATDGSDPASSEHEALQTRTSRKGVAPMEPVIALCVLTLFTWAVAIWATYGSDTQDREPEQEEKEIQAAEDTPKAA